jgi:hypothetical protein
VAAASPELVVSHDRPFESQTAPAGAPVLSRADVAVGAVVVVVTLVGVVLVFVFCGCHEQ